jgi:hypothetical protein
MRMALSFGRAVNGRDMRGLRAEDVIDSRRKDIVRCREVSYATESA